VTPALFDAYPDPASLGAADQESVETLVQPTGFFRQKAKNIRATGRLLDEQFGGVMPHTIEELTSLPGVARKTANVLISNCYPEHAAGIAVDTHVQRISRRLGLTRCFPPEPVERDLMKMIPKDRWNDITHLMIDHGRAICRARDPQCEICPIGHLCPSRDRFIAARAKRSPRSRR
jgi:endonuclease-3